MAKSIYLTNSDEPQKDGGNEPSKDLSNKLMFSSGQVLDTSSLTDAEIKALQQLDWKEGDPIPGNIASAIESVKAEASDENAPLPVHPATPPLKVKTITEDEMTEEQKEKVKRILAEAMAEDAERKKRQEELKSEANLSQSVRDALKKAKSQETKAPEPEPAEKKDNEDDSTESVVGSTLKECPHCYWPLHLTDSVELTDKDKQGFWQTFLAGKVYMESMSLFDGDLIIVFRNLTTSELDAIYRFVVNDAPAGDSAYDWEKINRFRLFLQLYRFTSSEKDIELPDGLSRETNPNASAFWEAPKDTPLLPAIEKWLLANVICSESIMRVLRSKCDEFNRKVAKLEALVHSGNFRRRTG